MRLGKELGIAKIFMRTSSGQPDIQILRSVAWEGEGGFTFEIAIDNAFRTSLV